MAEWLYEAGIGEARAALVVDGQIVKARIERDDAGHRLGAVSRARLVERVTPSLARVELDGGGEAMLDRVPPGTTLGARLTVTVIREPIPERGRPKLAKVAAAPDREPAPGPSLRERIEASNMTVRRCRAHEPDRFEQAGWSETLAQAESGEIAFPGGALRMSITPAMTLFDVDGVGAPGPLALSAAVAVAAAIVRFGIGGSIGLDLPGLANRAERQAVGAVLDAALPPPFERTAVNGFGFLQLVRPRRRASLPELLQGDPATAATLATLRRLERLPPPVAPEQPVPAIVQRRLQRAPAWQAELARRLGVPISFVPEGARHGQG